MLRVTGHSSGLLLVVYNWELVDKYSSEIVTCSNVLTVCVSINCVDICTVVALWEDTGDFPTEFTGGGCP